MMDPSSFKGGPHLTYLTSAPWIDYEDQDEEHEKGTSRMGGLSFSSLPGGRGNVDDKSDQGERGYRNSSN